MQWMGSLISKPAFRKIPYFLKPTRSPHFSATLDGQPIGDVLQHRFATTFEYAQPAEEHHADLLRRRPSRWSPDGTR